MDPKNICQFNKLHRWLFMIIQQLAYAVWKYSLIKQLLKIEHESIFKSHIFKL